MKKYFIICVLLSFCVSVAAVAQDVNFEASLEKNDISVGNPIYLSLTFHGSKSVGPVDIPSVNGLKIRYVGPSTKVSVINGRITKSIAHSYLIIPQKAGSFRLGPYVVSFQGKRYATDPIILIVRDKPRSSSSSAPAAGTGRTTSSSSSRNSSSTASYAGDKLFLTLDIGKRTMYVNEKVPVTIKLFVGNTEIKDPEYPVYSHEGFSSSEFGEPELTYEIVRGVRYRVVVFEQDLFGIKDGKFTLGPAAMKCKILTKRESSGRSSFFGLNDFFGSRFSYKTQPVEVRSDEILVTILPFPSASRPSGFKGAVGDFSMDSHISTDEVKVGDPIVVKTIIRGRGNLDTVTAPTVAVNDDFKVYEPQVTRKDLSKIYEQIIIPKTDKVKSLPKISFSFFDPRTGRYKTLEEGPFRITVTERPDSESSVKMVSMPGVSETFYPQEELGQDLLHIKEDMGKVRTVGSFLCQKWPVWAVQAIALVLFFVFYFSYRKRERVLKDKRYARFLKAPRRAREGIKKAKKYLKNGDNTGFYDQVFKTFQVYLSGRLDLPKGNIDVHAVEKRLQAAGCEEKMLGMVKNIFSKCEMARYASSVPGGSDPGKVLEEVKIVIDHIEKIRI